MYPKLPLMIIHEVEISKTSVIMKFLFFKIYCTRRMRWAGHVARMGEERGVYRVFVGKSKGRRPLGRPRRRWVDNIRTDLQEVGCGYMDWIGLAQDRDRWRTLVSAVMNRRVPWNVGNFLTSCKPVSFSRRTLHHGVSKPFEHAKLRIKHPKGTPYTPLNSRKLAAANAFVS